MRAVIHNPTILNIFLETYIVLYIRIPLQLCACLSGYTQ
jgi:hypothetical protein